MVQGRFRGDVKLSGEVVEGRFGAWALGEVESGQVLVDFGEPIEAGRGDTLIIEGRAYLTAGTAAGRGYGAVIEVHEVVAVERSRFWPVVAGRHVTATVDRRLAPHDGGRGLLAGFLIGDTSHITATDIDAMRRSGLAHFVAVSGSNVALFLGLLAVAAGPLALGPRRRAVVGLIALPVYAAATRFEPSVMRAAVMAGLALGGRLLGFVLEAWQLLALAVIVLIAADPELTGSVGFQLSVAATAGVLVGARWPVTSRFARALMITLGAQVAVGPILLAHFGTVPLASPLTNLVAAPLVAVATVIGAVGTSGLGFLVPPAAWLAELVLALARGAAGWPQLPVLPLLLIGVVSTLVLAFPALRALGATVGSAALVVALITSGTPTPDVGAVVLDVGQGDAILLHGGRGRFALVDGGPDPVVLQRKLREHGVQALELVVLTHVHADHATGLIDVIESHQVGQVWADTEPHVTSASVDLLDAVDRHDVPVLAPAPGTRFDLGSLELVVEGPVRRYASPNDQSIVVTVIGPARTMLLSGDVETHAQEDLRHLRADVLKVPHQGAATSDPAWLEIVAAEWSIVSVGPNDFGHPAGWVIELLESHGRVSRTDLQGDLVVDLSR
jgi:competence protein ComEC